MTRAITLDTLRDAGSTVYTVARRTPLVKLEPMTPNGPGDADPVTRIHLKRETLQPIGSFKVRGAANAVSGLNPEQLAAGVWTINAGNAAQGVALAARCEGAPCAPW